MAHRECPRVVLQDGGYAFDHAHCHTYCKGSIVCIRAEGGARAPKVYTSQAMPLSLLEGK